MPSESSGNKNKYFQKSAKVLSQSATMTTRPHSRRHPQGAPHAPKSPQPMGSPQRRGAPERMTSPRQVAECHWVAMGHWSLRSPGRRRMFLQPLGLCNWPVAGVFAGSPPPMGSPRPPGGQHCGLAAATSREMWRGFDQSRAGFDPNLRCGSVRCAPPISVLKTFTNCGRPFEDGWEGDPKARQTNVDRCCERGRGRPGSHPSFGPRKFYKKGRSWGRPWPAQRPERRSSGISARNGF